MRKNLEISEKRNKELQHLLEKSEQRCKELQHECGNHLIKHSKLESQISVLDERINCSERRYKHLSTEMDTLQEVITVKNEIIVDQEHRIKSLSHEITKLHDSLIQEKIHASRVDDSLFECAAFSTPKSRLLHSNILTPHVTEEEDKPNHVHPKHDNPNQDKPKQDKHDKTKHDKPKHVQPKQPLRGRQEHRRKQVLFIGTSNIKYVSCRYLAGKRYYVHKETKYTIDEATEYVRNYDKDMKPEIIIYHLLCNDIEKSSNAQILAKCQHLTDITNEKFPSCKIMISLGLPRGDRKFNLRINTLNIDLQNHYKRDNSIIICDNSNLFYRGMPLRGILRDRKHLSKQGVFLFSENLREELDCA
ncbi:hypothetical protein FSP39_018575 [Pinctada imbricata]|uniref:Uncharacterized protein n=1 Tax=Pinctada imbricata TaxID=66713 RepID=A0AA88YC83_PINIB|nr:hypothetical protein FSP39_018575 [Pinctada imbricata]